MYVLCLCAGVCVCVWLSWVMWHRAISLSYSTWWRVSHVLFPVPPNLSFISPSLPLLVTWSTSQFFTWPLRPALWPLSPSPELSLPLSLWHSVMGWPSLPDTSIFLSVSVSPLFSFTQAATLSITCFLWLHLFSSSVISYLPFNPHRHLFTVFGSDTLSNILILSLCFNFCCCLLSLDYDLSVFYPSLCLLFRIFNVNVTRIYGF